MRKQFFDGYNLVQQHVHLNKNKLVAVFDMKTVQEYNARVISGNTVTQSKG